MRATSRASLANLTELLDEKLRSQGDEGETVAKQLFTFSDALQQSGPLRRVLADPARTAEAKSELAAKLLSEALPAAQKVAAAAVAQRWSADTDLIHAIEFLGYSAALRSVAGDEELHRVEDELVTLAKALQGDRDFRRMAVDKSVPVDQRADLISKLLAGRTHPVTELVARRCAQVPRNKTYIPAVLEIADAAAARRNEQVAEVISGKQLSEAQLARITDLLAKAYGRPVGLRSSVDPEVVGGLRILIGSDVIDSTVLARLNDAQREIAS